VVKDFDTVCHCADERVAGLSARLVPCHHAREFAASLTNRSFAAFRRMRPVVVANWPTAVKCPLDTKLHLTNGSSCLGSQLLALPPPGLLLAQEVLSRRHDEERKDRTIRSFSSGYRPSRNGSATTRDFRHEGIKPTRTSSILFSNRSARR
jgi:hypothetical protein